MSNQVVSNQELLVSNTLVLQSLVRILQKKGATTEDEILEEIKALKVEMDEKIRKMEREN